MANDLGISSTVVQESYEKQIPVERLTWVQRKVDEAVRELIGLIPTIPARIEAETLDRELVEDKVVAAVLRVVRNPEGIESEGEGDYNIRLRNTVASGDIWFQEKDLIQLGYEVPEKRHRPRTVRAKATPGWGFPS